METSARLWYRESMRRFALRAVPLALAATACHSAGPYGHSKVYAPSSDETRAVGANKEYDALLAGRGLDKVKGHPFWAFGVVTARSAGSGGAAYLALSLRTLQLRNLCESTDEDSCRVTVSEREMGRVHALVALAAEDDMGQDGVGLGSLLRVVGTVGEDLDPADGTPVLRASFYRHWPRGAYVTTRSAGVMKR
jgi:hypothetical protein